jgi:WD40 repeat protein
LAFSSDCRWLASGGGQADKAGEVILWDLAKAAVLKRLEGHAAEVLALAIAPDRQTLVSSDAAGVINLWDLTQLEVRLTWTAHDGPVWALAIHPDGNALVTGGQDGRVKFWSLDSGRPMGNRRGHSSGVLTAAFSTHGRQLAIGCQDGHVKLWNIASKGPWIKLARLEKPVYSLTYSPERILLAAGPDKDVTFWQTKTQVKLAPQIGSPLESAQRERFLPPPKTATVRKLQELMSSLKDAMPEEIALRQKRFRDDLEAAEVS